MEYWKQELYHHGILGMKWGKRNGPPYPLSPGQHSESEKKAGWRKSLGGGKTSQRKPKESSENTNSLTKARQIADKVTRYEKFKKEREKHWSNETRPLELAIAAIKTHYNNKAIYYGTAFVGGVLAYKIADLTGHEEVIDIGKKVAFGIMATGVAYNTLGTAYNIARTNYDATHKSSDKKKNERESNRPSDKKKNDKKKNERESNRPSDWKETRRSYDPGVDKKNMTYHEKYNEFLDAYTPHKNSPNSLYDIDDEELIRVYMDDPNFRKEYGVNSTDYKIWKDIMGD